MRYTDLFYDIVNEESSSAKSAESTESNVLPLHCPSNKTLVAIRYVQRTMHKLNYSWAHLQEAICIKVCVCLHHNHRIFPQHTSGKQENRRSSYKPVTTSQCHTIQKGILYY